MTEDLRYPIGEYVVQPFSDELKEEWLRDIKFLPNIIESLVQDLDEAQLQIPYREGGWTIHQVVHHLADSHMNAYIRFKLGYTESNPTIKPYKENLWAGTKDVQDLPINISLTLLYSLHRRWHVFLESFTLENWNRTVFHPEYNKTFSLWELLGLYAWHGKHHAAHIRNVREREKF